MTADLSTGFVSLDVSGWAWLAFIVGFGALIVVDISVVHRHDREIRPSEAVIASGVWISMSLAFTGIMAWAFGAPASAEYVSGYLMEMSLSVDNIFVWSFILGSCKVLPKFQHRVLFGGIFLALILRAIFIFAGVAVIQRFSWVLVLFGVLLLYSAGKLIINREDEGDPFSGRLWSIIKRLVPSTDQGKGERLFTRYNGRLLATPLFLTLLLVEFTDIFFAVDSVPAVLALSREEFIVFTSNALAIVSLRSLYFVLAGVRSHFVYLRQCLAVVLAFVGIKMMVQEWYRISTWLSLVVILTIFFVAAGCSLGAKLRQKRVSDRSESGQ